MPPPLSRRWGIAILLFLLICGGLITYFLYDTFKPSSEKIVRKNKEKELIKLEKEDPFDRNYPLDPQNVLKKGFVVWSPSCRIPDLDPNDPKVKNFFRHYPVLPCSTKPLMSKVVREADGNHTLVYENNNVPIYRGDQGMYCCYSIVTEVENHNITAQNYSEIRPFNVGECITFDKNITFSNEEQCVFVKCIRKTEQYMLRVYKNLHTFVRKTAKIKEKLDRTLEKKKLSVLMIGIDSLSRLNFIRLMPNTYKTFLQDWIEFDGYAKVGGSTLPNLMAILTGLSETEIENVCGHHGPLDSCPLIWKSFNSDGYITAYGEDEPHGRSFHYNGSYFMKKETDHYFRPYMAAADELLCKKTFRNFTICSGPSYLVDNTLDYALDFQREYNKNATFSLFWFNSFSHSDISGPSMMDYKFNRFFQQLKKSGVFEKSLIIFFSDHGPRFGFYRSNYFGWLEDRMPALYMHVPNWWKREYVYAYRTLLRNRARLSSHYDLHLTLREALGLPQKEISACPNCMSLFKLLPYNRSCQEAGIPTYWCPCKGHKVVDYSDIEIYLRGKLVVEAVNKIVRKIPENLLKNGTRCAELKLSRMLSAIQIDHELRANQKCDEHIITVETNPGKIEFEAAVYCERGFQTECRVLDPIIRLSSYVISDSCVMNVEMSKYCSCLDESDTVIE